MALLDTRTFLGSRHYVVCNCWACPENSPRKASCVPFSMPGIGPEVGKSSSLSANQLRSKKDHCLGQNFEPCDCAYYLNLYFTLNITYSRQHFEWGSRRMTRNYSPKPSGRRLGRVYLLPFSC